MPGAESERNRVLSFHTIPAIRQALGHNFHRFTAERFARAEQQFPLIARSSQGVSIKLFEKSSGGRLLAVCREPHNSPEEEGDNADGRKEAGDSNRLRQPIPGLSSAQAMPVELKGEQSRHQFFR